MSPLSRRAWFVVIGIWCLLLGCGFTAFVEAPAAFNGIAYWAAQTSTPVPTQTRFLGMTTPVIPATPVPGELTLPPAQITVTATPIVPPATATPAGFVATPFVVTTTPIVITETPQPPMTTTPALPQIGFTTPVPVETPHYRIGRFYLRSDVYVGGPNGLVVRVEQVELVPSPRDALANYLYLTVVVRNYTAAEHIIPLSDLFFVRSVAGPDGPIRGRWVSQNEPLLARGLPSYDDQQLTPLAADDSRTFTLGFVLPQGEVDEVGFITNWQQPLEGGLPVWFMLTDDPTGPHVDAHKPPPPTSVVLNDALSAVGQSGDDGGSGSGGGSGGGGTLGRGLWPTTGRISRGYGCHAFYTGVSGAGFGCPADQPWFHNGVDIANTVGTHIWSPVPGAVVFAGPNSGGPDCSHLAGSQAPHQGLGNYQKVQGRFAGDNTLHYFGHLSSFSVTSGDVAAGQVVSEMGSTGCSTGSHLHWMLYLNGSLVDPAAWAGEGP